MNGIVLAGGQSSRMGRDKALLPWRGKPLLAVLLAQMAEHCGDIVIAAGSEERAAAYRQALRGSMPGSGVRIWFAIDRYPDGGPLAGLQAALSELPDGYALAMGCDMPDLSPSLLERMTLAAGGGRADVVHAPGEPLHALYHTRAAWRLQELLALGERRLMRALEALDSVVVKPAGDELRAFVAMNTPAEYDRRMREAGAETGKDR